MLTNLNDRIDLLLRNHVVRVVAIFSHDGRKRATYSPVASFLPK